MKTLKAIYKVYEKICVGIITLIILVLVLYAIGALKGLVIQ